MLVVEELVGGRGAEAVARPRATIAMEAEHPPARSGRPAGRRQAAGRAERGDPPRGGAAVPLLTEAGEGNSSSLDARRQVSCYCEGLRRNGGYILIHTYIYSCVFICIHIYLYLYIYIYIYKYII